MNIESSRVLIVDDERANVLVLERFLQREGYSNVVTTTDAREVAGMVGEAPPDLVLLDVHMPFLDGFEILSFLRTTVPAETFLPVLVLTADVTAELKRRVLAAGANDFLTKPFDRIEVLLRIRNLLQARLLHRELVRERGALEEKVHERTRELVQSQKQVVQQERLRALAVMASGVGHDLNNALSVILGFADLLLRDLEEIEGAPRHHQRLRSIITAAEDAARMVDRLREFHRPASPDEVRQAIDVNALLHQAVDLTQPRWRNQASARGVHIQVLREVQPVPRIMGDPSELREAMTNLIFNAVDAMPSGGTIHVRSRPADGHVVVEVSDTGTGMAEEVRQRCLEPFFTTKGERGTGLGLAMVYGIVERHLGTLAVESAPGLGTTFRLGFPGVQSGSTVETGEEAAALRPLRILLVDDHPILSEPIAEYLACDGHTVRREASGTSALGCISEERFDLLITDQSMPGMSGPQLARRVRETSPDTAIIVLTGFTEGHDAGSDVDLTLAKPVPLIALRKAIATVLARRGERKLELQT